MMCEWNALLGILPTWLREDADKAERETITEIRLRINSPPEFVFTDHSLFPKKIIRKEDIQFCVNSASRYSPWAASTSSLGYITAPGGHRIGLCGEAIVNNGMLCGIREVYSLCIRIAKDFPGISSKIRTGQNILILGAPGWGKTTLLRDLIRIRSENMTVAVVDERGELFPDGFKRGKRMELLSGAPKSQAMEQLIRTMGPQCIAVDEITAEKDVNALHHVSCCGVSLMATAHASGLDDYFARPVYKPLHRFDLFDTVVILHPDRSFRVERLKK